MGVSATVPMASSPPSCCVQPACPPPGLGIHRPPAVSVHVLLNGVLLSHVVWSIRRPALSASSSVARIVLSPSVDGPCRRRLLDRRPQRSCVFTGRRPAACLVRCVVLCAVPRRGVRLHAVRSARCTPSVCALVRLRARPPACCRAPTYAQSAPQTALPPQGVGAGAAPLSCGRRHRRISRPGAQLRGIAWAHARDRSGGTTRCILERSHAREVVKTVQVQRYVQHIYMVLFTSGH